MAGWRPPPSRPGPEGQGWPERGALREAPQRPPPASPEPGGPGRIRPCVDGQRLDRRRSAPEAQLDLLDPRLQGRDLLLELREVALEDLAPAALVGEAHLDPAQGLDDRLVFLLEPLEAPVDLVEVPEHIVSELGEPAVDVVEPAVDLGEPVADFVEPAVDFGELASQEFDELLVLGRCHGPCLPQVQAPFKCVWLW